MSGVAILGLAAVSVLLGVNIAIRGRGGGGAGQALKTKAGVDV